MHTLNSALIVERPLGWIRLTLAYEARYERDDTRVDMPAPPGRHRVLDGEEVVGYLLTHFWEADAAATGVREAYVGQLGVRPARRRRGLGGLLLATALRSYRAGGYERAALSVDTANATGALGLYERAGFAKTDTWVTWLKPLD